MAPARSQTGQLDQISEAIGELKGSVKAIDRYVHEKEHNITNLTQAVNGIGSLVSREIAAAKSEINSAVNTAIERVESRIQLIDERVKLLEKKREREDGVWGFLAWLFQSPLLGWIATAIAIAIAWWKKP